MKWKIAILAVIVGYMLTSTATASQTYDIDKSHASVGFTVDHLVISRVRGDFREFSGSIEMDDEGQVQRVSATIEVQSIDTAIENRDNHLRSADFFDAEKYPQITFKSKEVRQNDGTSVLIGDLTIHGVTKEIALPFTLKGPIQGPSGKTRIGFEAGTVINRKDYGLNWSKTIETGGLVVGEEVELQINLEAIKQ